MPKHLIAVATGHAHLASARRVRAAPVASCSIRPPYPAVGSATRRVGSSTGWRARASDGGRCSRSAHPDAHGLAVLEPFGVRGLAVAARQPDAPVSADEIEAFVRDHPYWIGDWAAHADGDAIADQVRFAREWGTVRDARHARGISILGDIPFYVAADSADVRSHPELFQRGQVAGVPPDDWSATGQHWGNPVYDWSAMRSDRLPLVGRAVPPHLGAGRRGPHRPLPRFRRLLVDPASSTAPLATGTGAAARDASVFETVLARARPGAGRRREPRRDHPAVERLREEFGMPGCVVLQFMFTENLRNRPPPPTDDNVVIYTGTHDNDTTNGWWSGLSPRARARVDAELARLHIDEARPSWKLIRLAFASDADTAIVPAQDLLDLGSRARMNHPGRVRGSWRWQLQPGMLGPTSPQSSARPHRVVATDRLRSRNPLLSQRAEPEKSLIVDGSPGRRP